MQLSSLFLAATALLTKAAVADYMLFPTNLDLQQYGPARIDRSLLPGEYKPLAHVGFTLDPSKPVAEIPLDVEGDIKRGYLLRKAGPGKWALLARNDRSIPPTNDDITKPFAVENDLFVYKGDFPAEWVTCGEGRDGLSDIRLYLVEEGQHVGCEPTGLGAVEL
ncbi:hypothetical protein F5144DRAFT_553125 [Chaetomium tenue]|uniref:Uncharacterized protein n=1 Tax=Chaetomium tenue TaxID=1854479 RepID=A0ACB7PMG3_9PEZI|nr:hypothetical protein F5144DRAFT_553125 [Chaetomium globosum]